VLRSEVRSFHQFVRRGATTPQAAETRQHKIGHSVPQTGELVSTASFCFRQLSPWIVSCHAKDIRLRGELSLHLDEVRPGLGNMNYRVYLSELARMPTPAPLLLEHLKTAMGKTAANGRGYSGAARIRRSRAFSNKENCFDERIQVGTGIQHEYGRTDRQ
jgi:hypothetical protein